MNEEFSIFYLIHTHKPFICLIGFLWFVFFFLILAHDDKYKNLTREECKLCVAGLIFGGLLGVTPQISEDIMINYFPCEMKKDAYDPVYMKCLDQELRLIIKQNQHRSEGK
ncbi:hypothetical protein ACIP1X_19765 [Pseudomonas sp. NPDC088885]|uniref:hypothetical protein n=1 Tax=Pseudomonas sp. NPDC088885 TaxID=3364457 RepID=UPI003816A1DE